MKPELKSTFMRELSRMAEQKGCPINFHFELTGRCNLNCKMCYVHTMSNSEALQGELSTKQWLDIFEQACSAGMIFATLSGGECLLRTDFRTLYLHLYEQGVQLIVKTNGILLSNNWLSFFKKYPPREVQVSLYGTNDLEYYEATEMKASEAVLKNIQALSESGLKYRIQITPCKEAKPFFTHIIDYLLEKNYPFQISQFLLPPRDSEATDDTTVSAADICDYLCYVAKKRGKVLVPTAPELLPECGVGGDKIIERGHCTAGRNRCQIDWRGVMHPCVALPSISAPVLELGLKNAWNIIQEESKKLHFPRKCASCVYKTVCKPCYAARAVEPNSEICNSATCDLVIQKICCGLSQFQ